MQGPNAVLNVITIPPGARPGQQRIVIDGVRGAIFEYALGAGLGNTIADNPLVSSWAAMAGTDPFGNVYPQGFSIGTGSVFEGTDFVIDSAGFFFYSGPPAHGNLIASITNSSGTDPFGNPYGAILNIGNQQAAHFGIDTTGNVYLVNSADSTTIFMNPSTESIGFYPAGTGTGALSIYIAALAGNDSFGNPQVVGFTSQTPGGGLFININQGVIDFNDTAAADTITRQAALRALHVAAHNNNPILAADSPACDSGGSHASFWLLGLPQSGLGNVQAALFGETAAGAAVPLTFTLCGTLTGGTIVAGLPTQTGAVLSLLPGDLTVQSSVDGQFYDTEVQHVDLPALTVTAVTPAFTALGNPATVSARKYKFHVRGDYTEAAAGIARFSLVLAGGAVISSARLTGMALSNSNTASVPWAGVGVGTLGPIAGANPMTSKNFILDIWGEAVFSAGGTATFSANTSAAGDTYAWNGGTMEVYPVA